MSTPEEIIADLRAQILALQKPKRVPRVPCPFVTLKKNQCKKFCAEGQETCKVHSAPPKPRPAPKPRPVRVHCTGTNIRGNPCKEKCLEGQGFCARHDPANPPPERPKKSKAKKVAPVHAHALGEEPLVPCELCETHGDLFDPEVTEAFMVGSWNMDDEAVAEMLTALKI